MLPELKNLGYGAMLRMLVTCFLPIGGKHLVRIGDILYLKRHASTSSKLHLQFSTVAKPYGKDWKRIEQTPTFLEEIW